ncbi:MAG TPA: cysteine hydrolase [Vicinamibacteria bacterium]|nr:cysteine hydrolase [Vicinamibacteria bacterium]
MPMLGPSTALLLIDVQNDFFHEKGAYPRNGVRGADFAPLPERLRLVADAVHQAGGLVISSEFTLVPGRDGEPFISDGMRKMRPFLGRGDFAPGSFGQAPVAELGPIDIRVEKVAYSAFYMSRLEWVLRRAGVTTLLVGGVVTNGGVASTVRDAHARDFSVVVLSDGCAAWNKEQHDAALADLASVAAVRACEEAVTPR